MVIERKARYFEPWFQQAEQGGFAALVDFAKGLRRDAAAVTATLTLPWSNGQTEGQVYRLKLLRQQAYGRADFQILRARAYGEVAFHPDFLIEDQSLLGGCCYLLPIWHVGNCIQHQLSNCFATHPPYFHGFS